LTSRAAETPKPNPVRGFEKIQRYWDPALSHWNAKILPGEYYVTQSEEVITTVLGSCISACIRDPSAGVGGMNHFMLPEDSSSGDGNRWLDPVAGLATRYGTHAMESLINELMKLGANRSRFEIKLFGAGRILASVTDVGARNIEFVHEFLDNEGYAVAELRKAGFATLTFDSFAARGTTGAALSASPGYLLAGVADAYAALRGLSHEPRIDADRIAVLGFSFGADVAHLTAFEQLRSALSPGPGRFAAHVAFYPSGNLGAIAERGAYTGSPVLMLLGEKDDNLPLAKFENYLAYARAAGNPAPVETVIYPGAYHAWTVPSLATLRFYPDFVSAKKCPLLLIGPKQPMSLIDGRETPFDPGAFAACMAEAPGYSMGFDEAVRAQSIADAVRFLQRNLQP
jgi:chemotaxis receptor (MCP) glutamine deamidase CheD